MQNIDLYSGKIVRDFPQQFSRVDPEYFTRIDNSISNDDHKGLKKASRILSLIFALCIISFTAGLIIGIKITSGSNKELIDQNTKAAVTDISKKITTLIGDNKNNKSNTNVKDNKLFDIQEYPFVIKIGDNYTKSEAQDMANLLSSHGHTVILSKSSGKYKIFVGPYRSQDNALESLNMIKTYSIKDDAVIKKIK